MRASMDDVCGCFPTGRHYPGIADLIASSVGDVEGLCRDFEPSTAWAAAPLAVIDFETTGLSTADDRVIEVGVACFAGGELRALKNWLVNPGIPISEASRELSKLKDEDLRDAPPFAEVIAELEQVVEGYLPVAYNAHFDRSFMHKELAAAGRAAAAAERAPAFDPQVTWIDPLVWVRELYKDERGHRLTEICARLGIALDNAHRAASDAEATGRVLLALASRLPSSYGELIRLQSQYAARQDVDWAINYRRRG